MKFDVSKAPGIRARGRWSGGRPAAAVVMALGIAACGGDGGAAGGPGGGRGGAAAPTPVETIAAETGAVSRGVTVSGVVEPIRTVGVNSQTSGALLSVEVEEGDVLAEGGILARVDQRELEAQLAAAEAGFQVAEAAFQRAEQLRERRVITLPEYERDRTAYAAATAQLDQLRTRIGYATVRSPIAGVVLAKHVEAGDVVGNQTRLFTLGDVSTLVVRVGVSELDVVELNVGEAAHVSLDAFPGRVLEGRIRRVFPSADPNTRLVPVEVALDTGAGRLVRPGFLARIRFDLAERADVVMVPGGAVVGAAGAQSVFVVQEGRAVRRSVETGLTSEGRVEILSGLTAGEVVVVTGNNGLRDGAEVRIMAGPESGVISTSTGSRRIPAEAGA